MVGEWATAKGQSMACGTKETTKKQGAPWSARRGSWILVKPEDQLTDDEKHTVFRMKHADDKVDLAHTLAQRFGEMIRQRQPDELPPWLSDFAQSGIETLKGFAKGIKADFEAVTNAMKLPWSQGQTEGEVNPLKVIKRQMYGR